MKFEKNLYRVRQQTKPPAAIILAEQDTQPLETEKKESKTDNDKKKKEDTKPKNKKEVNK